MPCDLCHAPPSRVSSHALPLLFAVPDDEQPPLPNSGLLRAVFALVQADMYATCGRCTRVCRIAK